MLFINAAEHFVKGKRQNQLTDEHIAKIIKTYQHHLQEARYSRRVEMTEIEKNGFNLNISRYISTAAFGAIGGQRGLVAGLLHRLQQINIPGAAPGRWTWPG